MGRSMNLKTLRELKGISRKELAEATGISFRSIQDYEQGHKDLSSAKAETILKMSETLDCTMEDLISEVDLSQLKPSKLSDLQDGEDNRSQVQSALSDTDLISALNVLSARERATVLDTLKPDDVWQIIHDFDEDKFDAFIHGAGDSIFARLSKSQWREAFAGLTAGQYHDIVDALNASARESSGESLLEKPMVFRLQPEDEQPYVLMHRDTQVASLVMEPETGALISVSDIYEKNWLPIGARGPAGSLKGWWQRRAVPITQGNMREILAKIEFLTPQAYLLRNMGLSMTDCYWLKPANASISWKDVSLFKNSFDDVVGAAQFAGLDATIDFRNFDVRFPSGSTQGDVPKAWICMDDGRRCLVKGSQKRNTQQIFNEVVAAYIHRKQGKFEYADYNFYQINYGHGAELGVSAEAFTNDTLEFVPAADIIRAYRVNGRNDFDTFVDACVQNGLDRAKVRAFLDYQILTDFVITNTDRSYENFGVLRNSFTGKFVKMAPIFDSGNSMFYDLDMSTGTLELNNIPVHSFARNEAGLLRLVDNPNIVDLDKLLTDNELSQVLQSSSRTPEEIKILVTIYDRKKDLLFKLTKGDMKWMD